MCCSGLPKVNVTVTTKISFYLFSMKTHYKYKNKKKSFINKHVSKAFNNSVKH